MESGIWELSSGRTMVRADALFCMALGMLFAAFSAQVAGITGLPANGAQMLGVGSFLWGAFLFAQSRRNVISAAFLLRLALINTIATALLLVGVILDTLLLNLGGRYAFLLIAAAVGLFALWAYAVSRRQPA
jgi:hypothetical protein